MGLRDEQMEFVKDVVLQLIPKAWQLGFEVTVGEVQRPPEMQKIYYDRGSSRTLTKSNHLVKCAIDLNLFRNGRLASLNEIRPLGEFWESLHPKNRWGGNFSNLKDGPHFERNQF